MYRRLGGGSDVKQRPHPYRKIDFGFVFVRAVRAGEAKLRGRARVNSPVAGPRPDQMITPPANGGPGAGRRCPAGVPPERGGMQIDMQVEMQIEMQIYMPIDNANLHANRKCKSTCKSK